MKRNLLKKEEDSDPMSVVSNLFDVAMVFAVALMVALVSRYNMTEVFSQEDFTMVKNPGQETQASGKRRQVYPFLKIRILKSISSPKRIFEKPPKASYTARRTPILKLRG